MTRKIGLVVFIICVFYVFLYAQQYITALVIKGNANSANSLVVKQADGTDIMRVNTSNTMTTVVDLTVSDDFTLTDDATIGGDLAVTGGVDLSATTVCDTNVFLTTASVDTVLIAGALVTDKYLLTGMSTTPDSSDVLHAEPKVDTLIVHRPDGGTSGLKYTWLRIR